MARISWRGALPWLFVGCLALALLCPVSLVVQEVRQVSVSQSCAEKLKQLGLALHEYHDVHGSFPPAYLKDKQGKPAHSWRVLILPFLGHQSVYDAYRFDEPWDGPNNHKLANQVPDVYACPADSGAPPWRTNYVAVVGSQTVWPGSNPVQLRDITDGTSNTILLMETAPSDIHWMEPRDLRMTDLVRRGSGGIGERFASAHQTLVHVLFCDGSVHKVQKQKVSWRSLFSGLTRASGEPFHGQWLPGEEVGLEPKYPPESDASLLKATDILPHLEGRITAGRNYLYCSTFELAWDELRQKAGMPLQVEGDLPLVTALNRRPFPRSALAPESYVARMGFVRDGIVEAIRAEMNRKFPAVTPSLVKADKDTLILSYAFLQKHLPFRWLFDSPTEPLLFHGTRGDTPVKSFGLKELSDESFSPEHFRDQVTVVDYQSKDDFIVSLRPEKDEIILAKVRQQQTAAETLREVQQRIRDRAGKVAHPTLENKETLLIPKFAFNLLRHYDELKDKRLLNTSWRGLPFGQCRQVIRFVLNESGALLESEAAAMWNNGHETPPEPRRLIFDKPFLLYLKEKQAEEPYLVLWVENAELMEPAEPGSR